MWSFCRKLEVDLPQDVAIPFLDICPQSSVSYYRDISLSMFIAMLFTIARKSKHLRSLSIDEWIIKIRFICTQENDSAVKKKEL